MSGPSDPNVPDENILAASRALDVIGVVLADPDLRRTYTKDPNVAFETAQATDASLQAARYDAIPATTRAALEALSEEELGLLARIGRRLEEDGMYIDVPGVGKCYIK
jgi:hypothetical protein